MGFLFAFPDSWDTMQKLTLHLPKYRLSFQYRLIKRRRSALDLPIIPTKKILNIKYHVGGYTRKFFRYLFEHKAVKKILGTNIALMLVASSFMPTLASNNPSVLGSTTEINEFNIIKSESPISTIIAIQNPVEPIRITQGYSLFHLGLDLDGTTGDSIKSIKKGVVELVETSNAGYGRHIIINHGDGLKTLYAHLSKIKVSIGDTVETDTIIGEMGNTGHSTGDHLHFEVRDYGIPVNPKSILPIL